MDVVRSVKNCKAKSAAVQVYKPMSLPDLLYRLFVHKMSKKNLYRLSLYIKANIHKVNICKVGNGCTFFWKMSIW